MLSYAGRLQLIKTVIAQISRVQPLDYRNDTLNRLTVCALHFYGLALLLTQKKKSKVSWEDVCKPNDEGGLGIRKLCDTSRVFSLRLIWRLFTSSGHYGLLGQGDIY